MYWTPHLEKPCFHYDMACRARSSPVTRGGPAASLALNGALLTLVGLFVGVTIPLVPYPRLMLSAHNAGFTVSGTLSMVAALLLSASLCSVPRRAATVVVSGHVAPCGPCVSPKSLERSGEQVKLRHSLPPKPELTVAPNGRRRS